MRKAGTVKVEVHPMSLKSMTPIVPKDNKEKELLVEDLTKMGYEGLLLEPWALKNEAMVQEFQHERSNEWEGTVHRDSECWTADSWAEVYNFRKEGRGMAGRMDKMTDGKFKTSINPKDGHVLGDFGDPRERRVLEFVVPILYLKKPSRMILIVGNTIFGALSEVRKANWGQVLHEVVDKLVSGLEKGKPIPISPFLFHLYHRFECLREEELQEIEIAKECLEYGVEPEAETQLDVVEIESNRESLTSAEQQKILRASPGSKRKYTYRSPKRKSPVRNPDWKAMTSFDLEDDPFWRIREELDQAQSKYSKLELITKGASKLLSDCKLGNIVKELKKLKQKDTTSLEAVFYFHLQKTCRGRRSH